MKDITPRTLVGIRELTDIFKVERKTVLTNWKKKWLVGAHFVIASSTHHLYDPALIEHWLTYHSSHPDLHQRAIEKTLARLDPLHSA